MKELALYVHIPFCIAKCAYCDFNSYEMTGLIPDYLAALNKEFSLYKGLDYFFKTVYIGGGTPTILNSTELTILIENIYKNFKIKANAEFTIEANPGTLNSEKLNVLKNMGVNRLSIGLQAYQDRLLKILGRIHSVKDFEQNYFLARKIGFSNINIDVIFGLPYQSLLDFKETLQNITKLSPEHISCYALSVEKGTRFYEQLEKGLLRLPSEDEERKMYYEAINYLTDCGYRHYEISNFAKVNKESQHNLVYWKDEEYLGLGCGAHSYINNTRFYNFESLTDYIQSLKDDKSPIAGKEYITKREAQSEFCFLRLRLIEGIYKRDFYKRFGVNINDVYGKAIENLKNRGLLSENSEEIKLTSMGLDFANEVFIEFLP